MSLSQYSVASCQLPVMGIGFMPIKVKRILTVYLWPFFLLGNNHREVLETGDWRLGTEVGIVYYEFCTRYLD